MSYRETFSAREVTLLRHRFKQGENLTNLEIERLLWTAEFAIDELEHQLREDIPTQGPSPESLAAARSARINVLQRVLNEEENA